VAYALSDEMKIIDLGGPRRSLTMSTVGYFSDSWTSCSLMILQTLSHATAGTAIMHISYRNSVGIDSSPGEM